MESRAKFLGHPLHQMLIAFPLGVLGTAAIFDGIAKTTGNDRFYQASHYMIGTGVVSGLVSAVPGVIDFVAIPRQTRAKRVGLLHGIGNLAVTALFAGSWMARRKRPRDPGAGALAASTSAAVLALVTAWLGGELVDRHRIGIDDDAHADAPSSFALTSKAEEKVFAPEI